MATITEGQLKNLNIGPRLDPQLSSQQIDILYDAIVNGPKPHNPTMSERTFRYQFLPVLTGQVEDPERLSVYLNGGGGQVNVGVNIVDDEGKFLFEVPPLISTAHIKSTPDDKSSQTFSDIAMNIELLNRRSPALGRKLFQEAIWGRITQAHTKDYKPTEDEARWLEIFKRYDIKVTDMNLVQEENKTKADGASVGGGGNDDIEVVGEF